MEFQERYTLSRLQKGDTDALHIIYMQYAGKVKDFAHRLLGNPSDAEDVTHDVFLRVWENRKRLDKVESFDKYLFRMTKNAIINVFKHRAVRNNWMKDKSLRDNVLSNGGGNSDHSENLLRLIDIEIGKMPDRRRIIFHLSRYEKMSYKEIADLLNISPKTVQYHISIALSDLRKVFAEELK